MKIYNDQKKKNNKIIMQEIRLRQRWKENQCGKHLRDLSEPVDTLEEVPSRKREYVCLLFSSYF